jgi:hypothetical protein
MFGITVSTCHSYLILHGCCHATRCNAGYAAMRHCGGNFATHTVQHMAHLPLTAPARVMWDSAAYSGRPPPGPPYMQRARGRATSNHHGIVTMSMQQVMAMPMVQACLHDSLYGGGWHQHDGCHCPSMASHQQGVGLLHRQEACSCRTSMCRLASPCARRPAC